MKRADDSGVDPQKLLNWLKNCVNEVLSSYECESSGKGGQAITFI